MSSATTDFAGLTQDIKNWGKSLGFQEVGIADIDLSAYEKPFLQWLTNEYHGEMSYMQQHGSKRYHPEELVPGTLRVITVRMDYLPPETHLHHVLNNPTLGYISRYALGRDYHKVIRQRLRLLAKKINSVEKNYRVFTDSAPVLEKPLAEKSGLGWIGKHTNLINKRAGSWFFLGEIFTDLPLIIDSPASNHCGSCTACIDICPTKAIVGPYQLDARRCISYLTIELRDAIPKELRPLMGNRIYGCDDCQLICPWNKFAKHTQEKDFHPRHGLDSRELIDLFNWSEEEFLKNTEGSAIRRIGYECWIRNVAVALGNAPFDAAILRALKARCDFPSEMVSEHIRWGIEQQISKSIS